MKIFDITRDKIIAEKVLVPRGYLEKAIGLIGKNEIKPMFFRTRWGIHTFGVRFPIDVVVLDKNKKVIKIKSNLKPNRIFFWNPKYFYVLELLAGEIKKSGLKVGDQLRFD